jgi:glucose-1-phosphate thymidylyltransferase
VRKAVVLARGLGKRMRESSAAVALDEAQASVAASGVKAMMPFRRPFMDYLLSALADAGYEDACLIIGPEHEAIRHFYSIQAPPRRIRIHFAVQPEPRGTADAVLAAESFVAGEDFLTINSDNYYPVSALRALRLLGEAGTALFAGNVLISEGGIPPERVFRFAVCEIDADGYLARIIEKPDETRGASAEDALISVNCWRFPPAIFEACRRTAVSRRGELELPDAVEQAMSHLGVRFRVVRCSDGVLDLSSRTDVANVAQKLSRITSDP